MNIQVNTCSQHPTHFLAAIPLIYAAEEELHIPSENWPYPTQYKIGTPEIDQYYAEVWKDGMDWHSNYWIIESITTNDPVVFPLILFGSTQEESKFNAYDFKQLMYAVLIYRQTTTWIKQDNRGWPHDQVWPFVQINNNELIRRFGSHIMIPVVMSHASQVPVCFYIHHLFVPANINAKIKD